MALYNRCYHAGRLFTRLASNWSANLRFNQNGDGGFVAQIMNKIEHRQEDHVRNLIREFLHKDFFRREPITTALHMDKKDIEYLFNDVFEEIIESEVSTLIWRVPRNLDVTSLGRRLSMCGNCIDDCGNDFELAALCLSGIKHSEKRVRDDTMRMQKGSNFTGSSHLFRILDLCHGDINMHKLFSQERLLHLYVLSVSEKYQRRGLGMWAIIESIAAAKARHGVDVAYAEATSESSGSLFKKLGFVKLREFHYSQYHSEDKAILKDVPGAIQLWARAIATTLEDDPLQSQILSHGVAVNIKV